MAKKTGEVVASDTMARPPEGFRRVGSVSNAPWFLLEEGAVLYGVLENVYERPDERVAKEKGGMSKFFQLKLLQPAMGRKGKGEDAELLEVPMGDVVNLNYGPKTKELEKLVPDILAGAEYQVWILVKGKFKLSGAKSMWDMDVQIQQTKAKTASPDEPDFADVDE
jgi:hypothetical protein